MEQKRKNKYKDPTHQIECGKGNSKEQISTDPKVPITRVAT